MKKKTKKEIKNQLAVISPKQIVQEMEEKMPVWVKAMNNKEDMANAVMATGQEMLLVILDTLQRYHNFTDDELKQFTIEIEDVLKGVKEFEEHGLNILTPHSIGIVGEKVEKIGITGLLQEISGTRFLKEKMTRMGLEYPVSLQATPFIKKLQEKNK